MTRKAEVRVAAVQMDAQPGQLEGNLARAAAHVEEAASQGAQLIVLPELFSTGYEYSDRVYGWPEPLDGRTGTWVAETAGRLGVHLAGSFPVRPLPLAPTVCWVAAAGDAAQGRAAGAARGGHTLLAALPDDGPVEHPGCGREPDRPG